MTAARTVPHAVGCDCESCWREFRARYSDMAESLAREVFEAGAATARRYRAQRARTEDQQR